MTPKSFFASLGLEYVGRQDLGGGKRTHWFNFGNYTLGVREISTESVARRLAEHVMQCQKLSGVR